MKKFRLETSLTQSVWRQLLDGQVPIVERSDLGKASQFVKEYNARLARRSYVPEVVHGYLGGEKGNGVTRFVPILSKEDMAVYYHLCGHIGERVLKKKPRIFGGFRSIPISVASIPSEMPIENEEAADFQDEYTSGTFSNDMWFGEFLGFTQLIRELTDSASSGAFVATTDVANFYDTIEIPRLIERLRKDMPRGTKDVIELLEVFLGLWDRRTKGYSRSSKGIPQEIITDGSRFLSHYYLQNFDDEFDAYCQNHGLLYVRWADDMMIFGPNKKILEDAIHKASRLLLPEGLNLNAHKTKIYTRDELARFRGLDVLSAIGDRNLKKFRSKLRAALAWHGRGNSIRLDTIFRATLGYVFRLGAAAGTFEKNFIFETAKNNPEIISTLSDKQLVYLIAVADNPKEMFLKIRSDFLARPYAGARANFLMLIRKQSKVLTGLGVSARLQESSVDMIERQSPDSIILQSICAPAAKAALG